MCSRRIIPMGGFCGVASELERIGLRDASLPFDWVITDLATVTRLIQNNFAELFDPALLIRSHENPDIVVHQKYRFDFYHDFNKTELIKSQIARVESKYQRRIKRLYEYLAEAAEILFIHYAVQDTQSISAVVADFMEAVSSYDGKFQLLLIVNRDAQNVSSLFQADRVHVITVDPDEGDVLCRRFFRNKDVRRWIKNNAPYYISFSRRLKNRIAFSKKVMIKRLKRLSRRFPKAETVRPFNGPYTKT